MMKKGKPRRRRDQKKKPRRNTRRKKTRRKLDNPPYLRSRLVAEQGRSLKRKIRSIKQCSQITNASKESCRSHSHPAAHRLIPVKKKIDSKMQVTTITFIKILGISLGLLNVVGVFVGATNTSIYRPSVFLFCFSCLNLQIIKKYRYKKSFSLNLFSTSRWRETSCLEICQPPSCTDPCLEVPTKKIPAASRAFSTAPPSFA